MSVAYIKKLMQNGEQLLTSTYCNVCGSVCDAVAVICVVFLYCPVSCDLSHVRAVFVTKMITRIIRHRFNNTKTRIIAVHKTKQNKSRDSGTMTNDVLKDVMIDN